MRVALEFSAKPLQSTCSSLTHQRTAREAREFSQGDLYIAEDYLDADTEFKKGFHGHRAEMIGDTPYQAVHIKLSQRTV